MKRKVFDDIKFVQFFLFISIKLFNFLFFSLMNICLCEGVFIFEEFVGELELSIGQSTDVNVKFIDIPLGIISKNGDFPPFRLVVILLA